MTDNVNTETAIASNETAVARNVCELPFQKGKKAATYILGGEITLNLALSYEREAAEMILMHVADLADDDEFGGFDFFYPTTGLDITELPDHGRVIFSGKYAGKGEEKVLVAVILAYIPPMQEFLAKASEQARDFFETKIAELLAGLSRRLIDISEDGARLTGEIPTDAFAILAPKPRAVGADKFMPLAVAFTGFLIKSGTGGKINIPAADIRRALSSAHYVQTSAYADLEKPDVNNPKGLFGTALTKLDKLLDQAVADASKMETICETFRNLVKQKTTQEAISPEFLAEMHKAKWCERIQHDRISAVLKARAVKKTEAEEAGDALLSMLA